MKKSKNRWHWYGAVLAAFAGLALATSLNAAADQTTEVKMTAKRYAFDPNVIKVKQGDHVKLVITALDREHGIKIAAFNIDEKLPKGEPVTVEFTADKAGTFPFQCSHVCGLGHHKMKGQLIVE
ncbi:MAG TPA: cupredoxin domain-containing protein [Bryobacteraceae bacterium]|nr:cupredoxin domain-containing protein [Bryobacteraceae bacterium]